MSDRKTFFISGCDGNMGSRYRTILERLGYDVIGYDGKMSITFQATALREIIGTKLRRISGIIIATPTHCHLDALTLFRYYVPGIPILCEKPFDIHNSLEKFDMSHVTMVNQYRFLIDDFESPKLTYYNYFKHGGDGLVWDCINVIGLAADQIYIHDNSALWTCYINGQRIRIKDMDLAYYDMIEDWIANPYKDHTDYIRHAHQGCHDMIKILNDREMAKVIPLKVAK